MRILAFIALIASIGMLVLMFMFYQPMLDAPEVSTKRRLLLGLTFIFQIYILLFSIYLAIKAEVVKWEKPKGEV